MRSPQVPDRYPTKGAKKKITEEGKPATRRCSKQANNSKVVAVCAVIVSELVPINRRKAGSEAVL